MNNHRDYIIPEGFHATSKDPSYVCTERPERGQSQSPQTGPETDVFNERGRLTLSTELDLRRSAEEEVVGFC